MSRYSLIFALPFEPHLPLGAQEAKREEWDAKMKPSNQFRGLEPDEIQFLGEVAQEKRDEERARERAVEEELRAFKWVPVGGEQRRKAG